MSHMNESCHIVREEKRREEKRREEKNEGNEQPGMNESSYEQVMSHMNESRHI